MDVSEQAQNILRGEGEQPVAVVHTCTNDIGMKGNEVLQSKFRAFGNRLKKQYLIRISGLLPMQGMERSWSGGGARVRVSVHRSLGSLPVQAQSVQ